MGFVANFIAFLALKEFLKISKVLAKLQLVKPFAFWRSQCKCFYYRASYASAVLGVVILSVRPSVTRVLCD